MPDIRVAAAVDFGTHGTGFAWAFLNEANNPAAERTVNLHDQWQGQPVSYIKNRTSLLLDGGKVLEWGYEAHRRYNTEGRRNPGWVYADRFKMGLWDGSLVPAEEAEKHITAYLRVFYRFALDQIVAAAQVDPDEIRWCVTVPAIWGDRERDVMRKCAEKAGFPTDQERLLIAVEPEVAALYCEAYHSTAAITTLGRRFMVVDAGGGTVDLTTYEVSAEHKLTQLGYSPGDALGSAFVDKRFVETLLAKRLPVEVVDRFQREDPQATLDLMDSWERAKRNFDPSRDAPLNIPIPVRIYKLLDDAALARLEYEQDGIDDSLVLTPLEVRRIFDHIIGDVLRLVDRQIEDAGEVASVLLVGGFAQSAYLEQRLRRYVEANGCNLVVPPNPSAAVLLGAVHYALTPDVVVARCSRYTYGVSTNLPVEDGFAGDLTRKWRDEWGQDMVADRFSIFVRRGDIVPVGENVVRHYWPIKPKQTSMDVTVYIAEDREPRYVDERGCVKLGTITADLSKVAALPRDDQNVEVTMSFGGTEVVVDAKVVRTGARLNTSFTFHRAAG
ncbi:hypothetical protein Afil01_34950 [Actinorhabdospora filicis]|uniref:Hsp70 family protein n=1 Tax=Actinorhabdospora filicis TaxID=1785913 RepID=A0A9W6SMG8_9ACTN|nr:Hsp70 family protein [Actinorhabdospora filicis]GLZ78688.1 hypothetical protein Afil01_34950 [Actinorhabdospora filicis]